MLAWLFPQTDNGVLAFCALTGLGVLAAIATGRSFATSWSPLWLVVPAMIALAAAVHFLDYALFRENLMSGYYYGVTLLIMLIFASLGYRAKRATQMGSQYRWMFRNEGMFWRDRAQH